MRQSAANRSFIDASTTRRAAPESMTAQAYRDTGASGRRHRRDVVIDTVVSSNNAM
ncbi:MAG: hypothetical protein IPP84_12455 [Propionivibrio sp.]|uniref:hypothetical protein n=1 Tax=Propionivibrio sp. TaxID=2212460 RepID=UPI0025D286C8|nr:hypothetical protein [Propionivibrio sp.]MBL0208715.1 hypothetical protein [Propionivibrio sp.]